MYSRSFFDVQDRELHPPENYDGNAFKEENASEAEGPCEGEATAAAALRADSPTKEIKEKSSFLSSLPVLGGLFKGGAPSLLSALSRSGFGTEELLILCAAAYLFFSSGGDKECAIILLLLIFVK